MGAAAIRCASRQPTQRSRAREAGPRRGDQAQCDHLGHRRLLLCDGRSCRSTPVTTRTDSGRASRLARLLRFACEARRKVPRALCIAHRTPRARQPRDGRIEEPGDGSHGTASRAHQHACGLVDSRRSIRRRCLLQVAARDKDHIVLADILPRFGRWRHDEF